MRTKNLILFILVIFMVLPGRALADSLTFPAGSLIIPMDSSYQPAAGGGLLEAYGLIYKLLSHQDQQCLTDCGTDQGCRDQCEHDISVYWVIDDQKTKIYHSDLVIEVTDELLQAKEVDAVVRPFDNTASFSFNSTNGDNSNRISYRGSVFILNLQELTDKAATDAQTLINSSEWSAVKVHEALVSFTAKVHRKMQGTPPKIALMNNTEDRTSGNAAILESYLRLAGVCTDVYEVLTPNDIAGIAPDGSSIPSRLITGGFDFLWAPHWEGFKRYSDDRNDNGHPDVDDIVGAVKLFLESGKALLAECASIETFEYSANGRFLSDHGFAHNGGTNLPEDIVYNDITSPYSQIGDFPFSPEGGHLHNWRPYQIGDDANKNFNFDVPPTEDASYNATVTRYTIDKGGWDYYVGGHAFGINDYGYVVYLGGHKYAKCDDDEGLAQPNVHPVKLEFDQNLSTEIFKLKVRYSIGSIPYTLTITQIDPSTDFGNRKVGTTLEIDFTNAVINGKKIENLEFRNLTSSVIDIDYIELTWSNGVDNQQIKKVQDLSTDIKHLDDKKDQPLELYITDQSFTIQQDPENVPSGTGCAQNSNCEWKNIAGVRYILNTLFNIQYQITNNEFVRSAPIVAHPWLYQGSFEYSSYFGHFRRYNVTQTVAAGGHPVADWDTAAGGIPDAKTGNSDGRQVYTAQYNLTDKTWAKIDFDAATDAKVEALRARLEVASTDEAIKVINRLRGKDWDYDLGDFGGWVERNDPDSHAFRGNFGGIEHSAAAIVGDGVHDTRFTRSKEIAYVGDLYGMLHAIDTDTGAEQWAYIPSNLLGKLKNDRTDPNAVADFAAVDASPTVRDVYFDPDHDPDADIPVAANPSWHTILVCPQGSGGKTVFALDVTDPAPDAWKVLWEATDLEAPGGGMGHAFRASLDKVLDPGTNQGKWMVFVATSYADMEADHGGIHVYAFDLKTGIRKWRFSSTYTDLSINDIPGAVTTYDIDGDRFADRIYVGDMAGRMWELNAVDGSNPHGTSVDEDDPIPLFSAGIGNPISVSPATTKRNGQVILVFGTGGTNWATVSDDKFYYIYAVSATAAGNLSQAQKNTNYDSFGGAIEAMWSKELEAGEKVWSSPTIAANTIFIAVSGGTLESDNPRSDVDGGGRLIGVDLDNSPILDEITIGKVRGSLFVSNQHIYLTTIDNQIIQVGGENWASGFGNRVVLKAWRQF